MTNILRFLRAAPVSTCFFLICLVVYLAMVFTGAHFADPHSRALIAWGANYRALTVTGQPWRIVTSIFVHGGLLHFALNSMAIFDICWLLERRIGAARLLVVLLLSGLSAALSSMLWHPLSVSVGASGAIMGAAGALLVWLALPPREPVGRTVLIGLVVGVALTLGIGAFWHRLDNAAHVGGLVTGMLIGLLQYGAARREGRAELFANLAVLLFGLGLVAWVLRAQLPDEYRFRADLPAVSVVLQQFSDPRRVLVGNAGQRMDATRRARQAYQQCADVARTWQALRLAPAQQQLGQRIGAVCALRLQQYTLMWESQQIGSPYQGRVPPQFLRYQSEADALGLALLPALRQELETEALIQAQIGVELPKAAASAARP